MSEQILKFLESSLRVLGENTTALMDELLNFLMFEAILSLLGNAAILLAGYVVYRLLSPLVTAQNDRLKDVQESKAEIKPDHVHAVRFRRDCLRLVQITPVLIASLWVGVAGIDPIKTIVKISVAPNLFLIEEGAKLLPKMKPSK